ncbi:hypothetical protein [Corynebacterium cystitidis]|uniref:hypothetical protein n=1 Tax=Corynebacterium cystitidis TaxID=35757 RepID=UPI00211EBE8F|nr:hypothetical protein [Corynebacterium cystitidis]
MVVREVVNRPVNADNTKGGGADTSAPINVYDLAATDLSDVAGLIISGGCDQVELKRNAEKLTSWVNNGGRLLVNGHPRQVFVDKLPQIRALQFKGVKDVWLSAVEPHPIWEGIERKDVLLRTGVPGHHCFEELQRIGVAGFYAHAYLADLPENASVITGIGEHRMPVDVSYRLGAGEVIVHAGNDLGSFQYEDKSTHDLRAQINTYLAGGTTSSTNMVLADEHALADDAPTASGVRASTGRIAFVHTGSYFHLATAHDPVVQAREVQPVYWPAYEGDFSEFDAVYVAARCHPGVIAEKHPQIVNYLQKPGRKVFIDGIAHVNEWLPGTTEIPRGTNFWSWRTGEDVGRRSVNQDHPLWRDYLSQRSVHWHYHGVLAPPEQATPLVVLVPVDNDPANELGVDPWGTGYLAVDGHPNVLLYHDAATFAAELVVTTMDASYHHGAGFMPGATQLLYRMLAWLDSSAQL